MRLVFLGPPGAGKGTQSKIISNVLNIPHLSTGEILRDMSENNDYIGKELKNIMSKGMLVSDDMITSVVKKRILMQDCNKGFILDGYPRTLPQANSLESIMSEENLKISSVILVDVPEDELLKRITGRLLCNKCSKIYNKYSNPFPENGCGRKDCSKENIMVRSDDEEEAFKQVRLKKYYNETFPLIDYYKSKNLLKKFDGSGSAEKISKKIIDFINVIY